MCPACVAAAAWMVSGVISTGGAGALIARKLRAKATTNDSKEKTDSQKKEK